MGCIHRLLSDLCASQVVEDHPVRHPQRYGAGTPALRAIRRAHACPCYPRPLRMRRCPAAKIPICALRSNPFSDQLSPSRLAGGAIGCFSSPNRRRPPQHALRAARMPRGSSHFCARAQARPRMQCAAIRTRARTATRRPRKSPGQIRPRTLLPRICLGRRARHSTHFTFHRSPACLSPRRVARQGSSSQLLVRAVNCSVLAMGRACARLPDRSRTRTRAPNARRDTLRSCAPWSRKAPTAQIMQPMQ